MATNSKALMVKALLKANFVFWSGGFIPNSKIFPTITPRFLQSPGNFLVMQCAMYSMCVPDSHGKFGTSTTKVGSY
jgi:hypothetical protein